MPVLCEIALHEFTDNELVMAIKDSTESLVVTQAYDPQMLAYRCQLLVVEYYANKPGPWQRMLWGA